MRALIVLLPALLLCVILLGSPGDEGPPPDRPEPGGSTPGREATPMVPAVEESARGTAPEPEPTVREGHVVAGRVVGRETGEPVAGVRMAVVATDDFMEALTASGDEETPVATTDADGRFRIEGLAGGAVTMVARAAGLAPAHLVTRLPFGRDLELRMEAGGDLDLHVTGDAGGAWTTVYLRGGGAFHGRLDEAGHARIVGLPAGRLDLEVHRFGGWSIRRFVEIPRDGTARVDWEAPTGHSELGGRIRRAGRSPEESHRLALRFGDTRFFAKSDEDGAYRFDRIPAGPTRLRVYGTGLEVDLEIGAGENRRDLDLPDLSARVLVLDDATGDPVPGARAVGEATGRTDADGRVTLSDLVPGKHVFRVVADGYVVPRVEVVAAISPTPVEVRLARGRVYDVRVLDPEGRRLTGADVRVLDRRGEDVGGWNGESGRRFRLVPGEYVLLISRRGFRDASKGVVLADADGSVSIVLEPR